MNLQCESPSRRFQPGEGPTRTFSMNVKISRRFVASSSAELLCGARGSLMRPISFSVYMLAAEYKSSPPTGARPMSPVRPGPRPRPLVQHVVDTANKITASGHSSFRSSHSSLEFFNFDIDTVIME